MTGYQGEALHLFRRDPATGKLTEPGGKARCVSATLRACTHVRAFDEPLALVVSPDGTNLYVLADDSDSIAIFSRDPKTGALRQKDGTAGCISATGVGGCQSNPLVTAPSAIAISPDGMDVYVTNGGSKSITAFARDSATGVLTQIPGAAGCVSAVRKGVTEACRQAPLSTKPFNVLVSPDGENVYVGEIKSLVSRGKNSVGMTVGLLLAFDRAPATGELTFNAGAAGCISSIPTVYGCRVYEPAASPMGIASSRDGRNVYVTSENELLIFDRDSATGTLSPKRGGAGCFSTPSLRHKWPNCRRARGLVSPIGVAVSPDDGEVFVAAFGGASGHNHSENAAALVTLARNPATGELRQEAGRKGCVSADPKAHRCAHYVPLRNAAGVVVSPDGKNVYVAGFSPGTVVNFDRGAP